jgi:hypothetical protein
MIQLIYASRSTIPSGRSLPEFQAILSASQARNVKRRITGYLVADGRSFFQVLEGDAGEVRSTFERIASDPRHTQVALLSTRTITGRTFPEWSMGGWMCTADTLGIFIRHGIDEHSGRSKITGPMVLGLAKELRDAQAALDAGFLRAS